MTLSSLLLHPSFPLLSFEFTTQSNNNHKISTLPTRFKPYSCLKSNHSSIAKSHKLSCLEELKQAFPSKLSNQNNDTELDDESFQELVDKRCVDNVRMLIVDSVQHAKAGHPRMALGMAEVGYVLYRHVMRYNPRNPKWFNRDRFVLSAGHGCLLQYVCLHIAGFQSVQVYAYFKLWE